MKNLLPPPKKKYLLLILVFLVSANSFSQQYKDYYVVEKILNTLSSQSKSLNVDGSLNLRFQDTAYQAGTYSITLVSGGKIIESKNLIKN
jgi:hypothetical protein